MTRHLSRRQFRAIVAAALLLATGVHSAPDARLSTSLTGWEGRNNDSLPTCAKDHAGAVTAAIGAGWTPEHRLDPARPGGEIVAQLARLTAFHAFGERLTPDRGFASPLGLDTPLRATGLISLGRPSTSDKSLGFYNSQATRDWRTAQSLGARIVNIGKRQHLFYLEYGARGWLAGGAGPMLDGAGQPAGLDPGAVYRFDLSYDPNAAGGQGQVTLSLPGTGFQPLILALAPGHRARGARFDRFGVWSPGLDANPADTEVRLDDVSVGDRPADTFDAGAPGWTTDGAMPALTAAPAGPYTRVFDCHPGASQDFGYRPGASHIPGAHIRGAQGEVGGWFNRAATEHGAAPAFYAARLAAPVSLDDALYAEGDFVALHATSDSGWTIGFFNAAASTEGGPEVGYMPSSSLGVAFTGVSRAGYFLEARYRASGAAFGKADKEAQGRARLSANPDGAVRHFVLRYRPGATKGADGQITLTTADGTITLAVPAAARAQGAVFDRFGLRTLSPGGHIQEAYVANLRYTSRP